MGHNDLVRPLVVDNGRWIGHIEHFHRLEVVDQANWLVIPLVALKENAADQSVPMFKLVF